MTDGFESILGNWPDGGLQGYNIAPTQTIPIITQAGTVQARWGMIPGWAKAFDSKYSTFNARIETLAEKPIFRNAWKAKRSCLVPVGGYYEWKSEPDGKQPYAVSFGDYPMLLGGLWEPWNDEVSFTILTQPSTGSLENLHRRMPHVIHPTDASSWLDGMEERSDPLEWVELVQQKKVSRLVNNVRNDSPEIFN